ncbi:uncharacterized protein [Littorina saxatilis]|uniref:Endonuclease/exonuclease/phosphatase domain-containing protein n=1 Tax=Littorina saxatilis TaxID=31220 RepID=A0AAN9BKR3_9CAEN
MPRMTRKALADTESPSRSSPRASTKASTAAAGTPSPAKKTRGRGGKVEEEPESVEVETKTRGRSASRGKAAAPAARQSTSRGRSTPASKKTPTPARKGRGKAKKEEPEEDEEEEEEAAEEEEEEEEEVTPKRGRGRGRGRGKSPASAEKKTPPARGARSSRRSAEAAAEEEEKEEEPKKTTPRGRGRGRSTSASTSKSRSRRGRGAGEPGEEEEGNAEEEKEKIADAEEEEKMEEGAEPKKREETKESKAAEKKEEPEAETPVEQKEEAEKKSSPAKEKPAPPAEPMEEDAKNGEAVATQPSPPKVGVKRKMEEEVTEEKVEEPDVKRARVNGTETDKAAAGSAAADVEMTDSKPAEEGDELKDFVVVSKEEVPAPDSAEVAASVPRPAEEVKVAEAAAAPADVTKADVVTATAIVDSLKVIPLTEAEMAKAYTSNLKAAGRIENDDVSSVIAEVGSVAGSDITGSTSRGLDISEAQSASNSLDGDFAGDTSLNEGVVTPDAAPAGFPFLPLVNTSMLPPPEAQLSSAAPVSLPPLGAQPAVNLPSAPALNPTLAAMPGVPSVNRDFGAVPPAVVNQVPAPLVPPPQQSIPATIQLPASTVPRPVQAPAASPSSAQNSQPPAQLAKGSSSVCESLGKPEPAFLAKYSSPALLNRAFVSNPATPPAVVPQQNMFSVVTYNILAECHRTNTNYSFTPTVFLTQEYRHSLMMKELQYLKGDIVCLQEVGPAYFNTTLLPAMRSLGYDGLLKRRTSPHYDEGEATFYKTALFELEASKGVSLAEAALKEVELGGLTPEVGAAVKKYLDRADVVLITRLRSKATGKVVTVGNIHTVWDNLRSPDVQCIQAACAIKEVVGMAGSDGAHIICGDFNAEWSSPIYQLVLDGYLSDSSIATLQGVQRLELNDGAKSLVNHLWRAFQHTSSNLKSAYATVTKSEPEVTTFSPNLKGSVDYVFYSAGSLAPTGVLKTIDRAVIDTTSGLPTRDFPSDHLSVKAVMAFTK